jgi:pimeloyl-ACP methyl ester carboxylesterase
MKMRTWMSAFLFMLKRYMHKRERYFAMLNDNRVVRPFEWGTEFIGHEADAADPHELFKEFSRETLENSDDYFSIPSDLNFVLGSMPQESEPGAVATGSLLLSDTKNPVATAPGSDKTAPQILTWASSVATSSPENNTAYATYFPHENHRAAVIILPHWNAKAGTYFDLCKFFNKVGISALRLTLPYHEERMPPELERADYLVAPNVGRSLQSIRQSVADTRAAVTWLKQQGYEKVGVVGTSIGSCVAFLAFVHDAAIDGAVFNHVSGYMADVVWHGLSTYHVRHGFGDNLELDELREYWLPVSPMAYMEKLAAQEPRPQRYIYTLYDLSFPVDLSRDTMRALRRHKIKHSKAAIPCGHYTLGEKPWVYLDGYKIIKFLHKHLR